MANDNDDQNGQNEREKRSMLERDIAHRITHELSMAAVVLVTVAPDGSSHASMIVHCGVAEDLHAAIGETAAGALRATADAMTHALASGATESAPECPEYDPNTKKGLH